MLPIMSEKEFNRATALGFDPEKLPRNKWAREQIYEYEESYKNRPRWMKICGLNPREDQFADLETFERCAHKMTRVAKALLRKELLEPQPQPEGLERCIAWDPIYRVTMYLGISQSQLSRFVKASIGASLTELLDMLKMQKVREVMRAELEAYVNKQNIYRRDALALYRRLKDSRKSADWHRTTWAISLGFSSYTRFYRACLNAFRKLPQQIEMDLLKEILAARPQESAPCSSLDEEFNSQHEGTKNHEVHEETERNVEQRVENTPESAGVAS